MITAPPPPVCVCPSLIQQENEAAAPANSLLPQESLDAVFGGLKKPRPVIWHIFVPNLQQHLQSGLIEFFGKRWLICLVRGANSFIPKRGGDLDFSSNNTYFFLFLHLVMLHFSAV